jgi:hypothetical protein
MLVAGFNRFHFIIYYALSDTCHFQQLPFLATMPTIQIDTNSAHSCCKLYLQIRSCVTMWPLKSVFQQEYINSSKLVKVQEEKKSFLLSALNYSHSFVEHNLKWPLRDVSLKNVFGIS